MTKQLITQFHIYESFDRHDKFMANVLENFWLFTLINDSLHKKGKKLGIHTQYFIFAQNKEMNIINCNNQNRTTNEYKLGPPDEGLFLVKSDILQIE